MKYQNQPLYSESSFSSFKTPLSAFSNSNQTSTSTNKNTNHTNFKNSYFDSKLRVFNSYQDYNFDDHLTVHDHKLSNPTSLNHHNNIASSTQYFNSFLNNLEYCSKYPFFMENLGGLAGSVHPSADNTHVSLN